MGHFGHYQVSFVRYPNFCAVKNPKFTILSLLGAISNNICKNYLILQCAPDKRIFGVKVLIKRFIHLFFGPVHWDLVPLHNIKVKFMRVVPFVCEKTKLCRGWKERGTWSVERGLIAVCSSVAAWLCNNTSCNQENRAGRRATPVFLQYLDSVIQVQTSPQTLFLFM